MVQFACTGTLEDVNHSTNGSKYLVIKVFKLYTKEKEVLSRDDFISKLETINPYNAKDGKEVNKKYNGYIYINFTKVLSIKNKETKKDITLEELESYKGYDIYLRFLVNFTDIKGNVTYFLTPLKDILITEENNFNAELKDDIDNFEFFNNILYYFIL